MYCIKCGSELIEGAMFCSKCGEKVEQNPITADPVKVITPVTPPKSVKTVSIPVTVLTSVFSLALLCLVLVLIYRPVFNGPAFAKSTYVWFMYGLLIELVILFVAAIASRKTLLLSLIPLALEIFVGGLYKFEFVMRTLSTGNIWRWTSMMIICSIVFIIYFLAVLTKGRLRLAFGILSTISFVLFIAHYFIPAIGVIFDIGLAKTYRGQPYLFYGILFYLTYLVFSVGIILSLTPGSDRVDEHRATGSGGMIAAVLFCAVAIIGVLAVVITVSHRNAGNEAEISDSTSGLTEEKSVTLDTEVDKTPNVTFNDNDAIERLKAYAVNELENMGDEYAQETVDDYFTYQLVRSSDLGNGQYVYFGYFYIYRTLSETVLMTPDGRVYDYDKDKTAFEEYRNYFSFDITDTKEHSKMLDDPTFIEGGDDYESSGSDVDDIAQSNLSKWPGKYWLSDKEYIDVYDTFTEGKIHFGIQGLDASGEDTYFNEYTVDFTDPEMTEFSIPYQSGINEIFRLVDGGIQVSLDNGMNGANDGLYIKY